MLTIITASFFGALASASLKLLNQSQLFILLFITSNLLMFYFNTKSLSTHSTVKVFVINYIFSILFTCLLGFYLFEEEIGFNKQLGVFLITCGSLLMNTE